MTAASGADPAEIVRQRAAGWPDFHPEDYCHACGRPNPTWFADTAEWQTATGSEGDGGGILCPSCFCALWEQVTGRTAIIWRLSIDPRSRDTAPASGADQPTLRDQLAEALAAHIIVSLSGVVVRCSCGWVSESRTVDGLARVGEHRAHVADALLPVVERAKAEAAAEARDAAADELLLSSLPENHWAVVGLRARAAALRSNAGGEGG